MKHDIESSRIAATSLAEKFLSSLGICCLIAEPGDNGANETKLMIRSVAGQRIKCEKLWFRSRKEIEKVSAEIIANRGARQVKTHLIVGQRVFTTMGMVQDAAVLLGIKPISDYDLTVTFDSVVRRLKLRIEAMWNDGSMRALNQEYHALRLAQSKLRMDAVKGTMSPQAIGTTKQGQFGDNGDIRDNTVPPYQDWLADKLVGCLPAEHLIRFGGL